MTKSGFWLAALVCAAGIVLWLVLQEDAGSDESEVPQVDTAQSAGKRAPGPANEGPPQPTPSPEEARDTKGTAPDAAAPDKHPLPIGVPWSRYRHRYEEAMQAWMAGNHDKAIAEFRTAHETAPAGVAREETAALLVHACLLKGEPVDAARTLVGYLSGVARHIGTAYNGSKSLSSRTIFRRWMRSGPGEIAHYKFHHFYGGVARRALYPRYRQDWTSSGHEEHLLDSATGRITEALEEIESPEERRVMEAGLGFLRLNVAMLLPRRRGSKLELKQGVLTYVDRYGSSEDPRIQPFVRYLREVLPDWIPDAEGKTHKYTQKNQRDREQALRDRAR